MLGCGGLLRFSDREFREQFPKAYHVGRYVAAGDDEGDGQNDHRYAAAGVSGSPKTATPKKTAVTGSSAPRMAVGVDPMY